MIEEDVFRYLILESGKIILLRDVWVAGQVLVLYARTQKDKPGCIKWVRSEEGAFYNDAHDFRETSIRPLPIGRPVSFNPDGYNERVEEIYKGMEASKVKAA